MKIISNFWSRSLRSAMLLLVLASMSQCGKDDEPDPQIPKSSEKQIISFNFLAAENSSLNEDVMASINEENKSISVNLPSDTPLESLTPAISISANAAVSPSGTQDFTIPVNYIVTAEDGSQESYTVTASSKKSDKKITSFVFLLTENALANNVVATIDEENKTISATMPADTDITGLLPDIEISPSATVSPNTAQNFTNPVVYTVTAEDGSKAIYSAEVQVALSQRQILQAILDANPGHIINWNLSTTADLGTLEGVDLDVEGNIIRLDVDEKNLSILPEEIGQLSSLTELDLGVNKLTSIPAEIGNLTNLTSLKLSDNEISSIPAEIGNLASLTTLFLGNNKLTSVPAEIWQLTNLTFLRLASNNLSSISNKIGNLTSLIYLQLENNQLTSLPEEIGFLNQLTLATVYNNSFNVIPQCICNIQDFKTHNDVFVDKGTATCTTTSQKDALISIYSANPGNTLGWGVDNFPGVEFAENGSPRFLTMNNKNLTRLPNNIDRLTALEGLIVSTNALGILSSKIGNNSSLIVIAAANTNISTVPASFGLLTNLALLSLEDNPITGIPSSVCDQQVSNGGILTILTDPGEGCD